MNKDKSHINNIEDFLRKEGRELVFISGTDEDFQIHQKQDKKTVSFKSKNIKEIIKRKDIENSNFLQVDFHDGKKILFTHNFIGFAPASCGNLDLRKLPKVVTTVDLMSVIEAIESSIYREEQYEENLDDVRMFFESIACGAEAIGFNLAGERLWVEKLISNFNLNYKKSGA